MLPASQASMRRRQAVKEVHWYMKVNLAPTSSQSGGGESVLKANQSQSTYKRRPTLDVLGVDFTASPKIQFRYIAPLSCLLA